MPTIYTGYARSLYVTVSKYLNGIIQSGYPIDYNGNNEFTFDGVTYPTIVGAAIPLLSSEEYAERLTAFKGFVAEQEGLPSIEPFISLLSPPVIFNPAMCPIADNPT